MSLSAWLEKFLSGPHDLEHDTKIRGDLRQALQLHESATKFFNAKLEKANEQALGAHLAISELVEASKRHSVELDMQGVMERLEKRRT